MASLLCSGIDLVRARIFQESKTWWQDVASVDAVLDSVVIRLYEGRKILLKASVASSRCGEVVFAWLLVLLSSSIAAPNIGPVSLLIPSKCCSVVVRLDGKALNMKLIRCAIYAKSEVPFVQPG